jgi:hypothetical protein
MSRKFGWSKHFSSLGVLLVLLLVVAAPTSAQQLRGEGEWQSLNAESVRGRWQVTLTRTGSELQGTIVLTGSNVLKKGPVAGTINGSDVVLGVMSDGARNATFAARIDGESVSGEWESAVASDHGVWTGKLSSVKSQ